MSRLVQSLAETGRTTPRSYPVSFSEQFLAIAVGDETTGEGHDVVAFHLRR